MTSSKKLAERVRARANHRCEYCCMCQSLQGAPFHIEHILPRSEGGESSFENLALACPSCNLHKSNRTQANIPGTPEDASLFHPRWDAWSDHFSWKLVEIVGKTDVGRATIVLFNLNSERRLAIREAESTFGLFPP